MQYTPKIISIAKEEENPFLDRFFGLDEQIDTGTYIKAWVYI